MIKFTSDFKFFISLSRESRNNFENNCYENICFSSKAFDFQFIYLQTNTRTQLFRFNFQEFKLNFIIYPYKT